MHLEHQLNIDAPVGVVWKLTADVESWPAITPTMTKVERLDAGPLATGARVRVKQPWQRATIWTITEFEPETRFAWQAKVLGVAMVATHSITTAVNGCTNTLTVDMSGRAAGLLGRVLGGRVKAAIRTENEGFKRAAESAITI